MLRRRALLNLGFAVGALLFWLHGRRRQDTVRSVAVFSLPVVLLSSFAVWGWNSGITHSMANVVAFVKLAASPTSGSTRSSATIWLRDCCRARVSR